MAKIHLIGGEKGGVGKSMVARLVAQYLIDHSIPFLGFDSDRSHGALLRFYAGYASPVSSIITTASTRSWRPPRSSRSGAFSWTSRPRHSSPSRTGWTSRNCWYWHPSWACRSATGTSWTTGKDSVDLLKQLLDRYEQRLILRDRAEPIARRGIPHPAAIGPARAGAGLGRSRRHRQAPAGRDGDQDRRQQQQLLGRLADG